MGLRTDFVGYWIEVMVERAAKVIFFCRISNIHSSFTNPHLLNKRRLQHSMLDAGYRMLDTGYKTDPPVVINMFCCNSFACSFFFQKSNFPIAGLRSPY